jgi:hypothetical protein
LVVRGEPGIGKSELLDYVVASARGFKIVRAAGSESETELAFALLRQVCAPFLGRIERLVEPQRDALQVAFGLKTGDAPDPFLVGLGLLSLLPDASDEQPLLCVVDNEYVVDQASAHALAFAARRLFVEPVAMVFATSQAIPELAGGFGTPAVPALSTRIEDGFRRRFESLPPDTRLLSLLAAAESTGDPAVVWRAAERLGVAPGASAPATAAGLLEIGARVRFRHPLARSAAYHVGTADERLRVHRACGGDRSRCRSGPTGMASGSGHRGPRR